MSVNIFNKSDGTLTKLASNLYADDQFKEVKEKVNNAIGSDAYDNSKSYAVGDTCIDENTLWKCKIPCSGVRPSTDDGTYWSAVTLAEISNKGTIVNGVEYKSTSAMAYQNTVITSLVIPKGKKAIVVGNVNGSNSYLAFWIWANNTRYNTVEMTSTSGFWETTMAMIDNSSQQTDLTVSLMVYSKGQSVATVNGTISAMLF